MNLETSQQSILENSIHVKNIGVARGLGFSDALYVENRASIADLFTAKKRCGIYLLHFVNGEAYCGQAIDVTRRFCQHIKTHEDIKYIQFQEHKQQELNTMEKKYIYKLEDSGFQLRNIVFSSLPNFESDFDAVMPLEDQEKWLKDFNYKPLDGQRVDNPDLRRRYSRNFENLKKSANFTQTTSSLRKYICVAIPIPQKTELSFWSVSCLPSGGKWDVYCRICLNFQEVLTIIRGKNSLEFSVHTSKSVLEKVYGKNPKNWSSLPPFYSDDHIYEPGGQDQIHLIFYGVNDFLLALRNRFFIKSLRVFNLRLMKKRACVYSRFHCFDLADLIIQSNGDQIESNKISKPLNFLSHLNQQKIFSRVLKWSVHA